MASILFAPLDIGPCRLGRRMVVAPLTRASVERPGNVPWALNVDYYRQRASPGGVMIVEVSQGAPQGQGMPGTTASIRRTRLRDGAR